jgi:hypothetical protein
MGEGGQRTLSRCIEEAFGEETGFKLLERELEGAGAPGLHGFGDELKLASGLVHGDTSADEDGKTVRWTEAQELSLAAEEDDRKLGVCVLESEVDVSRGSGAAVGDLAFDPEIGIGDLDLLADSAD